MKTTLIVLGVATVGIAGWYLVRNVPGAVGAASEIPLSVSVSSPTGYLSNRVATITSRSRQPITMRRIVINDKEGIADCDFHLGNSDASALSTQNVYLFGSPRLKEGDRFAVDLEEANKCGASVVRIRIETDLGNENYDISPT